jgi:hypothetical protein
MKPKQWFFPVADEELEENEATSRQGVAWW